MDKITPVDILQILDCTPTTFPILKEPRFIRIAFFDSPETPRVYNGYAAQLFGNDMYGGFILLKTLEVLEKDKPFYQENSFITSAEWEWNGGEDLTGEALEEAKELYQHYISNLQVQQKPQTLLR